MRAHAAEPADFSLYLLGFPPQRAAGRIEWICWPDFGLPLRPRNARVLIVMVYARSARERVEVCCGGGVGRTGTVLTALAMLDGLPFDQALAHVRANYHPRAVETPWQRRYLRSLEGRPRPRAL